MPPLVLASASPRRAELLRLLGARFVTRTPDVDEAPVPGEDPVAHVRRLAAEKARAVARPGELIVAADTTVALDGEPLGKPRDDADARAVLRRLSGRSHLVHTAVAVRHHGTPVTATAVGVATSEVAFTPLSESAIEWYVATGEPSDKAGGYGVQGAGGLFVASISGSPTNVIGLPLPLLAALLSEVGADLLAYCRPR
ncbi:MAG: septum formation protein Maf [Acidimicrobiales bacterium]|nr:septum formation protein Maf [Acidimicrobiales bacterium]